MLGKVTKAYVAQYPDPIRFGAGDAVRVERADPEFPGWFWCSTPDGGAGWVHGSFLAAQSGDTTSLVNYSSKELTVVGGEEGESIHVLDGWVLVKLFRGEVGWIPEAHFVHHPAEEAGAEAEDGPCRIEMVPDTMGADCDLVRQWLREFNVQANPEFMALLEQPGHQALPLVLLAKVDGKVVGGLLAETQLSWLRISIMAVDPRWRACGIGSALLEESVRQALVRGCRQAYVDTMDYQAPGFYQSQGFAVVGRIPDWDSRGHAKLYLTKRLA
ncbi:GNAT family N-acetyltransferase [Luteolibacter luteus]|uniref:GNAT family N-acetyltransferase n=1 Tax=Luteolibacter luteus TaxID=2728835 RepID=A0A858RHL3_9BACT|nr:GNAT family N-acetyltransferase [Luteolibacter luteus]QJE95593.1 GNAT family N-acetyltransferase [Luteolibacter luteus]